MIQKRYRNSISRWQAYLLRTLICSQFMMGGLYAQLSSFASGETPWSVRMAETVMTRHPSVFGSWDYVTGTVMRGFEELWYHTGDSTYYRYIQSTVDAVVRSNGTIKDYNIYDYNIDEIKEGCTVLFMFRETGEEKYHTAANILRSQLENHPRTSEGGFWHKQRYPWQMWLDGLYMGSPFYSEYGLLFDEPAAFDDVVNQLTLMETHARDDDTGLLYHGWAEQGNEDWADPVTGCSASFWGRAIGWYAMALVDVLDNLPESHQDRDEIIAILQRLAEAVSEYQDESTGVWWQVVDRGGEEGNYLESSVSCMLVYALFKGVRLGYLDAAYQLIAVKGYNGIIQQFITESSNGTLLNLNSICRTAGLGNGRDGSYEYYVYQTDKISNDGKAIGPFILASLEMEYLATAVNRDSESNQVSALTLKNYPNPFNPLTQVEFSVPRNTHVQLFVFNTNGQKIMELYNKPLEAGKYSVSLNASGLQSGVYICRLVTDNHMAVKKILYIK